MATLRNAIQQGQPIIVVSDAMVSTTGHGACAWNLWSNQILWSGAGRVPGSSHDMYSGLAEAFGVYMSIQFVIRYLSQYPIIYHRNARITVYCDNQGVIDRIASSAAIPYPRDMIANDYPIYQEIQTTITQLHPIKLTFRHVDGHLDTKKPKRPLTIAETLNIDCDTRATQHFQSHPPLDNTHNPVLEHSYPHLHIGTQVIYRQIQHVLRDTAMNQEYFTYLQEKFQWTNEQVQDIHWPSLQQAMRKLTKPEWRIINKFIHEWLPLETRYHVQSISEQQLCPSCHLHPETAEHFLQCTNPD